ncbi:metallophosphoesterase [Thermococcus sp.]
MDILALTDIHGRAGKVRELVGAGLADDADLVLVTGDITNFGGGNEALNVLKPLLEVGRRIYTVFGNCDGRDVPKVLEELGVLVHNRRVQIDEVGIVGLGGSNPTPFRTIWELSEDEIRGVLVRNHRPGDFILSHVPPYGTKADLTRSGLHVGSRALREFIEEHRVPLVVTGHIHEARTVDRLGETVIVNPGPLFRGYYAWITVKDETEVELERL